MKLEKQILRYIADNQKAFNYTWDNNTMVFKATARAGTSPALYKGMVWFVAVSSFILGVSLLFFVPSMWVIATVMLFAGPAVGIALLGSKALLDIDTNTIEEHIGGFKTKGFNLADVVTINQVTLQTKDDYAGARFELLNADNKKVVLCIIDEEPIAENFGKLLGIIITEAKKTPTP